MQLFVQLRPVPYSRPRFNGRTKAVFDAGPYRQFKRDLQSLFRKQHPKHIPSQKGLLVGVYFYFARPKSNKAPYHTKRSDLDNLIKAVFDAGNELIWKDDAQICGLRAAKHYCKNQQQEGIEIEVTELD